jgi:hypothetical protein
MNKIKELLEKLSDALPQIKKYLPPLFGLLVVIVYGVLLYRVQVLNSRSPSDTDVLRQSQSAQVPHIDPKLITQLKNLQDNSVSVQSLFNAGRSNPFNE